MHSCRVESLASFTNRQHIIFRDRSGATSQKHCRVRTKFQVAALASVSSWALVTLVVPARVSAVEDATAAVEIAKQVTHTLCNYLSEATF